MGWTRAVAGIRMGSLWTEQHALFKRRLRARMQMRSRKSARFESSTGWLLGIYSRASLARTNRIMLYPASSKARRMFWESKKTCLPCKENMCKCTGRGNEIHCSVTGQRHCAHDEECYGENNEVKYGEWS